MKESIRIFKALRNPIRLEIVKSLISGEKCVCEITSLLGLQQSTVSNQLSVLQNLGIVESRREGKSVYYRVINEKVIEILRVLGEVE